MFPLPAVVAIVLLLGAPLEATTPATQVQPGNGGCTAENMQSLFLQILQMGNQITEVRNQAVEELLLITTTKDMMEEQTQSLNLLKHDVDRKLEALQPVISILEALNRSVNSLKEDMDGVKGTLNELQQLVGGTQYEYLFVNRQMNWYDARQACLDRGYYLATIESEEENQIVFDTKPAAIGGDLWLDGTNNGHRRCWLATYPSLHEMPFTKWARGEPDNFYDQCLSMSSDKQWYDTRCTSTKYPMCKRIARQPVTERLMSLSAIRNSRICTSFD